MRINLSIILAVILLLVSCINDPDDNNKIDQELDESIIIKTGTAFGLCAGYCTLDVTITKSKIEYISSSWDKENYPTITKELDTDNTTWNKLLASLNFDEFEQLDSIIGCPDCADGGSEWIEIIFPDKKKKVTFEYGDSLEGMNDLLTELRDIRTRGINHDNIGIKVFYSNSFENMNDTLGWKGISPEMFKSEPAPNFGQKSLYIGGGCVQPAATFRLGNLPNGVYYLSFWAKVEPEDQIGEIVIANGSNEEPLPITIDSPEWKEYEIGPLSISANQNFMVDIIVGGFVPAYMFIDNLNVYTITIE